MRLSSLWSIWVADVRWVGGLTTSPCQNPETFSLPVITTDVRWFLGMSQDAKMIGSFFHTLRCPRLGLSFFFFNSSRRVFVALVFSFDKFFSCSILPKRLSLFVLFRSCISCLLSCSRCMSALHGIGIAYRSTTMQLSPHPPGSVTCFSSSRLGSSSPHCISSSEFGYLGAITLRGCQCHPLRSLKAIRSLFSNGKEIFLRMGLLRFETPSLSFQDPRTTSEDSCISTVQVWHSFTRGGAILRSNSSSLPHYMVCIW